MDYLQKLWLWQHQIFRPLQSYQIFNLHRTMALFQLSSASSKAFYWYVHLSMYPTHTHTHTHKHTCTGTHIRIHTCTHTCSYMHKLYIELYYFAVAIVGMYWTTQVKRRIGLHTEPHLMQRVCHGNCNEVCTHNAPQSCTSCLPPSYYYLM